MPNLVNKMVVREFADVLGKAEGMLLVSYGGLTVSESEALRNDLAKHGVTLHMVRNSLARRVFAEHGFEFAGDAQKGNTAAALGSIEGIVGAAKVFTTPEVKKVGKVTIRAGLFEGRAIDAAQATALAGLPDRNTLRAQLLGVISGPARGLVTTLNGLPSGFARILKARAEQLEGGGEAASA
jgi:large subunit ribosomal protein L10